MIKLIKIFNIELEINYSLIPIIILGIFFGFIKEFAIVFTIVTLHELAHSLVSNFYGYEAKTIELFALGGVVRSEEISFIHPKEVINISISGPLLNFLFFFLGIITKNILLLEMPLLDFFNYANLSLGLFNLMPIIPLDGGRILRAYLCNSMDIKRATYTTVFVGKVLCMIIFVIGIILTIESIRGITLIVFAVYLYFKNEKEKEIVSLQHIQKVFSKPKGLNEKINVKVKYIIAYKESSLKDILKDLSIGYYCIIRVLNNRGKFIGELTEGEILDAVIKYDSLTTLGELLNNKDAKYLRR
ncbi:M50 family metallopeptidase [Serpentinicella alkaliphila]|uniref:Stage IV sporulation protein FB n=1 Tax=Serpentinicella alkaliphila TaxID=1734049 RepID=A0A4R2TB09_9FIRM|nr:M50 family metallopeptidase [Serpentinicella alkaliphila]QUH26068.1 M50 family metallopeptidase [Serpentinicella alkaliphila]TCP99081.1 stage IV sporulation protein FB [Serpentinicella alkaliphila]